MVDYQPNNLKVNELVARGRWLYSLVPGLVWLRIIIICFSPERIISGRLRKLRSGGMWSFRYYYRVQDRVRKQKKGAKYASCCGHLSSTQVSQSMLIQRHYGVRPSDLGTLGYQDKYVEYTYSVLRIVSCTDDYTISWNFHSNCLMQENQRQWVRGCRCRILSGDFWSFRKFVGEVRDRERDHDISIPITIIIFKCERTVRLRKNRCRFGIFPHIPRLWRGLSCWSRWAPDMTRLRDLTNSRLGRTRSDDSFRWIFVRL